MKFQTNLGSFEPGGGSGPSLPEPSAALLFALGAFAFGRGINRRR
jgi:MYXO-CTERM domain-containing protein